jgi:membrane protease YdiL (CAAX protease family)
VVSALIFGLFHINPAQIVPAFLLGLLFAYIYYTTKSLLPTIILHIVSNGLSVCLMRLPDPIEDITELVSTGPAIGITIASAILLFFSTRCIERLK